MVFVVIIIIIYIIAIAIVELQLFLLLIKTKSNITTMSCLLRLAGIIRCGYSVILPPSGPHGDIYYYCY